MWGLGGRGYVAMGRVHVGSGREYVRLGMDYMRLGKGLGWGWEDSMSGWGKVK